MKHIVVDGDCMASIANQYGFADAKTILDHPDNADLKRIRPDGNLLYPGDQVSIPARKPKTLELANGQRHKIVIKRPTRLLRIKFLDAAGNPLTGAYTLTAGALMIRGTLDGDGVLEQKLPVQVVEAQVEVAGVVRKILVGHLNPLSDTDDDGLTGAQARLSNLGFAPGKVDGDLGPKTRASIRAFQEAHDLQTTGELDDATRDKLRAEHGC